MRRRYRFGRTARKFARRGKGQFEGKTRAVSSDFRRYPGPYQMPMNVAIHVQFRNVFGLVDANDGTMKGVIPCDPSTVLAAPFPAVAIFPEWSSIVTLFSQVKCVQLEAKFLPTTLDSKALDVLPIMTISGTLSTVSAPTGFQPVSDNSDSQQWSPSADTSGRGRYHAIRHRKNLEWATTALPAPSTSIYAGCPGGIAFYGSNFPTSSGVGIECLTVHVTGTYLVSNRT